MKPVHTLAVLIVAAAVGLSAQTPSALGDAQKALGGELPGSFKNFVAKGVRRNINGKKVITNRPENLFYTGGDVADRSAIARDEEQLVNAHVGFAIVSLGFFAREFRGAFPMEFFKNANDADSVNIEADQLSATFKIDPITHLPSQLGWREQGRAAWAVDL